MLGILHFIPSQWRKGKKSAASFSLQVASVPDMFLNFYLVKNHIITNHSTTTKASEKISADLEFFDVCLTKFKTVKFYKNRISHRLLLTTKLLTGQKSLILCKSRRSQLFKCSTLVSFWPMFVERKICSSALFTNLVRWHTGAVSFPLSDVILAQPACPLSDIMFCLHSE
jgi:hypothetical protein